MGLCCGSGLTRVIMGCAQEHLFSAPLPVEPRSRWVPTLGYTQGVTNCSNPALAEVGLYMQPIQAELTTDYHGKLCLARPRGEPVSSDSTSPSSFASTSTPWLPVARTRPCAIGPCDPQRGHGSIACTAAFPCHCASAGPAHAWAREAEAKGLRAMATSLRQEAWSSQYN